MIDLRSDTVTLPTEAMRAAMAAAPLGDDVYGEDPSVNQLETLAAQMLGKSAGLFVPSGTMGNLAAMLAHCGRGDEVILGDLAHTFLYEAGGVSALGGVHSRQLPNQPDGTLNLDEIRAAIRADDPHFPVTRLIALENTHNRCGGAAIDAAYMQQVGALAREFGLKVHLDGARLFNAAAVLGTSAAALAHDADSVTVCLSKGLCAPVGSVLCGEVDFIRLARRARKMLGGGMRQAGVLAAAGIVALETMPQRLHEDHARAHALADGLRLLPGVVLDSGTPRTNMVYLTLSPRVNADAQQVAARLREAGILVGVTGARRFRLVTHYWIDDDAVARTVAAFADALSGFGGE
ncbi:MAG: low-specificity L-threonine aldolase [Anaerolineales bacterium]